MKATVNRRAFLKTASAAGLAAAAAPIAHAGTVSPGRVKKWDMTVDIAVIGYGAAGANAALTGARAGNTVCILEKAPHHGGNSGVNLGGIILPKTLEDAKRLYANYSFDAVSPEDIEGFAKQMISVPEYLASIGFDKLKYRDRNPTFPNLAKGIRMTGTVLKPTGKGAMDAFKALIDAEKNVTTLFSTQATAIVQHEDGEVIGVIAKSGGKTLSIKARKGVVLCCGGYENNRKMIANFNYPGIAEWLFPCGTPYNTGDGVKMAISCGADLWHFPSLEWSGFCSLEASKATGVAVPLPFFGLYGKNYIYVNKYGKRFMKDTQWLMHTKEPISAINFSNGGAGMEGRPKATEFSNMPPWLVFDETTRLKGPVCANSTDTTETRGDLYWYSVVHKLYDWSQDNSREIEKGWILKADTVGELAEKMSVPREALEKTVSDYNSYCEKGEDPEFQREKKNLLPVKTGPFYAMRVGLAMINTQGGPRRNAKGQILDTEGKPIPRLYGAGELGSFFGFLYQGANNYPEAIITGHCAADEISRLAPHRY